VLGNERRPPPMLLLRVCCLVQKARRTVHGTDGHCGMPAGKAVLCLTRAAGQGVLVRSFVIGARSDTTERLARNTRARCRVPQKPTSGQGLCHSDVVATDVLQNRCDEVAERQGCSLIQRRQGLNVETQSLIRQSKLWHHCEESAG
jgi:hypothetical protein